MATITLGNSYRFKDYNNNKYLNILVNGNPANNSNVTIYSLDSADMGQVWKCDHHSGANVSGVLMKSAKDTSFALDRWRGSSNYNNADVYKIGTTDADLQDQLVEFLPISNGYYRIKLVYADLYLTVSTTTAYGGYNVNWQAITGNADQLWAAELYSVSSSATPEPTPTAIKDKEFFVKAYGTNLNLNVYGTDTVANARNVNAYEKEDCLAQRWIAKQTSAGPKLFTKINQSYALNINTADNNCTMYTASGNDNDSVLEFEEAGDMLYRIKMFKYGKYLTVNGSTSGSNVVWSDYSSTATLWEFIPEDVMFPSAPKAPDAPEGIVGNTYAVQANGTDFYLNVYGTDTVADGRNVNIYSKDDCLAQRWFIKNTDNGPKLFTKVNEEVGYTLNIYTTDDNCTMYTDSTENDADSILEFVSVGNMLYRIKMYHHDKYLCIDGAATSGANVKWISGASSATVWKFVPEATAFPVPISAPTDLVGKTFFIKNYNTGYNLNVHGTNTIALGRNVNVYAKEPEDSQRWQVVQTPKGPKIITEINPDFALNIHMENNNNCVMYDIDDNNADSVIEFVPYDEDKNIYKLKMFHHNKYLEAAGVGSGFNAFWSDSPTYPLWQFVTEEDMFPPAEEAADGIIDRTFFIQNVNTGYFLNINGNETVSNTAQVNVYAKENVQAQRWVIRNTTAGPKMLTKLNENFALNIYAKDNNCTMYDAAVSDTDTVLEIIPYSEADNIYHIKMHYHDRYLTVSSLSIGAKAYWTAVDTEPCALWKLIPESEMTFDTAVDTDTTPDSTLVNKFIPAVAGNYMVGRNDRQISEITIHHMAGNMSIESLGAMWQNPAEGASSHYGINGLNVGQYVKECNTAYTNGGTPIDPDAESSNYRAITIEVANSIASGDYPVSEDSYRRLYELVADIARRNNLGTLVPGQNLTWHSMYSYTECPGDYLRSKMQDIADKANVLNSNAVFIRKLGTQYPLVLANTQTNEGYGLVFSETVSENNQKWFIVDTDEGKEIVNAFDTTQNLRLNSTNEIFVVSSDDSLSKAYLTPSEDNEDQFTIRAAVNGVARTTSFKWLTVDDDSLVATAFEAIAEYFDKSQKSDAPFALLSPSYYPNKRFKIKKGDNYLAFVSSNNSFSFAAKSNDIAQVFEIENRVDGAVITSLADSSKYLSLKASDNTFSTMLPLFEFRSVSPNISFVPYNQDGSSNKFFVFSSRYNKYLGVDTSNVLIPNGELVWSGFDLDTRDNFIWEFEEPDPIQINDWLVAYYNPIRNENKELRQIPNYAMMLPAGVTEDILTNGSSRFDNFIVDSYTDDEGKIYVTSYKENSKVNEDNGNTTKVTVSFTNRNNWATKEAYTNDDAFVPDNVKATVSSCTGIVIDDASSRHTIESGRIALYNEIDAKKYYWIAVGPNVIFGDYPVEERLYETGDWSYYDQGMVDAVITDSNDNLYYIHCLVGDSKAHTWTNGFFQTDFSYMQIKKEEGESESDYYSRLYNLENHDYESIFDYKDNEYTYNYCVCVEFMGSASTSDTNKYELKELIFYPFTINN